MLVPFVVWAECACSVREKWRWGRWNGESRRKGDEEADDEKRRCIVPRWLKRGWKKGVEMQVGVMNAIVGGECSGSSWRRR